MAGLIKTNAYFKSDEAMCASVCVCVVCTSVGKRSETIIANNETSGTQFGKSVSLLIFISFKKSKALHTAHSSTQK